MELIPCIICKEKKLFVLDGCCRTCDECVAENKESNLHKLAYAYTENNCRLKLLEWAKNCYPDVLKLTQENNSQLLNTLNSHTSMVESAAFSPDSLKNVTGGSNGSYGSYGSYDSYCRAERWDSNTGMIFHTINDRQ